MCVGKYCEQVMMMNKTVMLLLLLLMMGLHVERIQKEGVSTVS